MGQLLLSLRCSFLLVIIFMLGASSAPQNRSSSNQGPLYKELVDLLHLTGPWATKTPEVNVLTLPLAKEFFKHRQFVEELARCFDIHHSCEYPGLLMFIDRLGEVFVPGEPCPRCPRDMDKIVAYSQNQFQRKYRSIFKSFLLNVSDFFGTLK